MVRGIRLHARNDSPRYLRHGSSPQWSLALDIAGKAHALSELELRDLPSVGARGRRRGCDGARKYGSGASGDREWNRGG